MSPNGTSRHFAAAQQLRRFGSEADINSRRDLLWLSFARISPDDMFRKYWHVVRSPRLLAEYSTMNRPEFAKRLANNHPNQNNVPFPERGDFLLAERIHAGAASFSLRKSARVIDAPGLLELLFGEIGAQDAQRLHVRKLALVDRLGLRLLGFDRLLSFPRLVLLRPIEFDLWRVGVEFLAAPRSIVLVVAKDLEENTAGPSSRPGLIPD